MSGIQISQTEYTSLTRKANRPKSTASKIIVDPKKKPLVTTTGFDGFLKEAVVLMVNGNGTSETVIIHHPVGITPLPKGEWVMSSIEDVNQMLKRVEDPRAPAIERFIRSALNSAMCFVKYYTLEDGIMHFAGNARHEVIKLPQKIIKTLWRSTYPPENYQKRKGQPNPPKRPKVPELGYIAALVKDMAMLEVNYLAFLKCKEVQDVIREKIPPTGYQTCAGTVTLSPQVPIPALRGCEERDIFRMALNTLNGTVKVKAAPPSQTFNQSTVGLKTDSFLEKPFDVKSLGLRMKKEGNLHSFIIKSRTKILKQFSDDYDLIVAAGYSATTHPTELGQEEAAK